ncbi:MAG: hypothetical protein MZU91_10495 [Desulfosudis oleivorans]|nr:hypothetical protein [Desulfosudis oleivorans]
MSCIIDDLLLLSKADTKEIKLNIEEVALRDLIMDVCMNMKVVADKKSVELQISETGGCKTQRRRAEAEKNAPQYC